MSTRAERAQGTAFAILYARPAPPEPPEQPPEQSSEERTKQKDRERSQRRRDNAKVDPLQKLHAEVTRDNKQRSNWTLT